MWVWAASVCLTLGQIPWVQIGTDFSLPFHNSADRRYLKVLTIVWVELCPPERYIEVPAPDTCACDLMWEWDPFWSDQVKVRKITRAGSPSSIMTGDLEKREIWTQTKGRKPCDDGGTERWKEGAMWRWGQPGVMLLQTKGSPGPPAAGRRREWTLSFGGSRGQPTPW